MNNCRHIEIEVEHYPDGSTNVVCAECGKVIEHYEGEVSE